MATILTRDSISVFHVIDIVSTTWYYKLQASTASAPAKPTTEVPSGWSTSEPSYTEGSTNSLYVVEKTTYSNGTFEYSDVSLSSSYEAAKTAYNKSMAVQSELNESRAWYAVCSTDAAEVAKVATVSPATNDFSLREGMLLLVKFTKTNSGAVGNLTLNVNGTGSKSIKYIYNGSLSNIPNANYLKEGQTYQFYYDGTNWVVQMIYNTNTNTVGVYGGTVVAGQNGIRGYSLVMKDTDNTWVSITTDAGAGTKDAGNGTNHIKYAGGLHPDAVMYENTQANYAEGATAGTCYLALGLNLRYSTNCGTTLVKGRDVYLVGTIGSDGLFYLDDTWWTQTPPTTEDGKAYIRLGIAYSTYQIYLSAENPIYQFYESEFRLLSEVNAMEAAKVATKYVTDQTDGIFVHPEGEGPNDTTTPTGWKIRDALELFINGIVHFKVWYESQIAKVRVGREDAGHTDIDSNGLRVYGGDGTNQLANIGYGEGNAQDGGTATEPYYTLGTRYIEQGERVGNFSVAEGENVEARGYTAHGEGHETQAIGAMSHAEGSYSVASGQSSHAEGSGGTASGTASHKEGSGGTASGLASHTEGVGCTASAQSAHAGGDSSIASGQGSFAHGENVRTTGSGCAAVGEYNSYSNQYAFAVGNGDATTRKNAFTVGKSGNAYFEGRMMCGSMADGTSSHAMFVKGSASKTSSSVASNGTQRVAIDITKSGYIPMAIAGVQLTGSAFTYYAATITTTTSPSGDTYEAVVYVKNNGSSASTTGINLIIFYIAESAV